MLQNSNIDEILTNILLNINTNGKEIQKNDKSNK